MVVEERDTDLESTTNRLEGVVERIDLCLASMLASMDAIIDSLNARMGAIETRMNIQIALTLGMWATTVALLLAVIFED